MDLRTAVFRGSAPDGGLYLPRFPEPFAPEERERLRRTPWPELASRVLTRLLRGALPDGDVAALTRAALSFPVPLVEVADGRWVLELFHGPTLAFKDVGARFLARLMSRYLTREKEGDPVTVLVATSGDTGGAVADAFHGLPRVRVAVLFPRGRVSSRQERQFSTLGGNVRAFAVEGSFDDCQRTVRDALASPELRRTHRLTSANSINVGRLLPQVTYYARAWCGLPEGAHAVISVPSGNFGNLTAGLMALRLGFSQAGFVAATNANDVVPRYLETGRLETRDSVPTLSTAMDVGDPGNFERILHMYEGDRSALVRDVHGSAHSDAETRRCIRRVHGEHGYLLDPHGAVSWLGMESALAAGRGSVGVTLATAHPAKFAETVESVIGGEVPVPEALARVMDRERRVFGLPPGVAGLAEALERWE